MDDPKTKFEVAMGAAQGAAAILDGPDATLVVRTEHLVDDNTIEVHNEEITVQRWKRMNPLTPFDVEAFMGTFKWKKTIEFWVWIPAALKDLLDLVERAADCMNDEAMERVFKEATEAVLTLHRALDPLLQATLVQKSEEASAEVTDAVREYLKHKEFLEKRGVIKEHHAGFPRRQRRRQSGSGESASKPTTSSCTHIFFCDDCESCTTRHGGKTCHHTIFVSNCADCRKWFWGVDDDDEDDDDYSDRESDHDDPLHPDNLPETDDEEGAEKGPRQD